MADREDADPQTGPDGREDEGSFLARWSRRKQADQLQQEHPPAAGAESVSAQAQSLQDSQQATSLPELTDADMPPVESLDESSDYAAFMSPGISETLRKQALRRLFHLPGLHLPDGLDDYDEDFTRFAKLGDVITHEMKSALERKWAAADGSDQDQTDVEREADPEPKAGADDAAGAMPHAEPGQEATDNEKG